MRSAISSASSGVFRIPSDPGRIGHLAASLLLQSHGAQDGGRRSNKLDAGTLANFSEIGIFAQKTIARMNGVHVADFRGADHRGNVQITARALSRSNTDRFVGEAHVQTVTIGF
jgi:hypothetical protein